MMVKRFLASGLLATSLGLGSVTQAFAAEENLHPHRPVPIAGEILSLDDSAMTIAVKAEKDRIAKFLENLGLSAGSEITVNISSDTKLIENQAEVALSAFEVGQTVFVVGPVDGQTVQAKVVVDRLPKHFFSHRLKFAGEVTEIDTSGNTITVSDKDGQERTIGYTDQTKFVVDKEVASENDLSAGMKIKIKGHFDQETETLVAQVVNAKN